MHPIKQNILNIIGDEPATLDELFDATLKILNTKQKVVGLCWELSYSDKVSNTHSCPLNGVLNWNVEPDKPTGYKGWSGRLWLRLLEDYDGFGSELFNGTLVHTGTGGGGTYGGPWHALGNAIFDNGDKTIKKPVCYGWDCRIYLDDWPELEKWIMFCQLSDNGDYTRNRIVWQDDETMQKDKEILARIREKNVRIRT